MSNSSLAIISWMHTTMGGVTYRRYRARGVGTTYEKFYEWLSARKVRREYDNWPWHHWGFDDPKDDESIRTLWGEFFWEDEPDYTATSPDSEEREAAQTPLQRQIGDEMMAALQEAITEEINREIMISAGLIPAPEPEVVVTRETLRAKYEKSGEVLRLLLDGQ